MKAHCLCKNFVLDWENKVDLITPRRCGCSFCSARDICWVGEPGSHLKVIVRKEDAHQILRQGTETADFYQCLGCGQIVFASCVIDDENYAVINAATLVVQDRLLAATDTDFDGESLDVRLARRKTKWCHLDAIDIRRSH